VPEEGGWVVEDEEKVKADGMDKEGEGKGSHPQEEGKPLVRTECDSERNG
jgi:hypothetical protein